MEEDKGGEMSNEMEKERWNGEEEEGESATDNKESRENIQTAENKPLLPADLLLCNATRNFQNILMCSEYSQVW